MNAARVLFIPLLLVLAIAVYVVVSPGGNTVANPPARPAPPSTNTPRPTPTPYPPPDVPDGTSGRLTYEAGGEIVTVQLPDLTEVSRVAPTPEPAFQESADRSWSVDGGCGFDATGRAVRGCWLHVFAGGVTQSSTEYKSVINGGFSPSAQRFAAQVETLDGRNQIVLIEGVGVPSIRVLHELAVMSVVIFEWLDEERLLLSTDTAGSAALHVLDLDGDISKVADAASTIDSLYPSPDRSRFLYAQPDPSGWRLYMLQVDTMSITDLGNMGAFPAGTNPVERVDYFFPIAWSADGMRLAFVGGYAPRIMTTINLTTGAAARTDFQSDYPGEIKWSRDGSTIAVAAGSVGPQPNDISCRVMWVVNPITGAMRRLVDVGGCAVVWSPDGRFLAVKAQGLPGFAIVDIETGDQGHLTYANAFPMDWVP